MEAGQTGQNGITVINPVILDKVREIDGVIIQFQNMAEELVKEILLRQSYAIR